MTRVLQGALLVVALATGLWLWQREPREPHARGGRADPPVEERRPVEPAPSAPSDAREPAAPSGAEPTGALADRVRELEAEVERLSAELRAARAEAELDSAEAIHAALRELDPNDPRGHAVRRKRQRQLWEQLLERFPNDAGAVRSLADLSGSWIHDDPPRALEVLERFAARVGMPAWRQDALAANALKFCDRILEADRAYQRVIDSPEAPEHDRWQARFFAAYLYMQEGEYAAARARFEELIALAGPDPPAGIRDTVAGARSQLELIEKAEAER